MRVKLSLADKSLIEDMHRVTTTIPFLSPLGSFTKPEFPIDDIVSGYGYAWFTSEYRGTYSFYTF